MDTNFYVTAARATVGTVIGVSGAGTLEIIGKTRLVNGMYRIRTREVYGPVENRCAFADDYKPRHIFELAGEVSR